jgi:hypothetical protein
METVALRCPDRVSDTTPLEAVEASSKYLLRYTAAFADRDREPVIVGAPVFGTAATCRHAVTEIGPGASGP